MRPAFEQKDQDSLALQLMSTLPSTMGHVRLVMPDGMGGHRQVRFEATRAGHVLRHRTEEISPSLSWGERTRPQGASALHRPPRRPPLVPRMSPSGHLRGPSAGLGGGPPAPHGILVALRPELMGPLDRGIRRPDRPPDDPSGPHPRNRIRRPHPPKRVPHDPGLPHVR